MAKMLVTYYTRTKHTQHMAEAIAAAAAEAGAEVDCRPVADVAVRDLLDFDAIVMGSPTYYGLMAAEVKKLLDDSVSLHGQLAGKVAGAFASSANLGGGNETTVLSILQALLIHGMVVQGSASGDHYGPVAVGEPEERDLQQCRALGKSVAELAARLHG